MGDNQKLQEEQMNLSNELKLAKKKLLEYQADSLEREATLKDLLNDNRQLTASLDQKIQESDLSQNELRSLKKKQVEVLSENGLLSAKLKETLSELKTNSANL